MTGEQIEQDNSAVNDGYNEWARMGSEVPFAGEKAASDSEEYGLDEIANLEQIMQRVEDAGFEIKKTGEVTVLGMNQDGKAHIESAYRDLWGKVAQEDEEFYNDVQNREFATTLWDVCNAAMLDDLKLTGEEDKISDKLWQKGAKLAILMQNPEYERRATEVLGQMEEIGRVGEMVSVSVELAQQEPSEIVESRAKVDTELQRKQEYYVKLNQLLDQLRSKPYIDSDEWGEMAAAYDALGDYADAKARADELRKTIRRIEEAAQF